MVRLTSERVIEQHFPLAWHEVQKQIADVQGITDVSLLFVGARVVDGLLYVYFAHDMELADGEEMPRLMAFRAPLARLH